MIIFLTSNNINFSSIALSTTYLDYSLLFDQIKYYTTANNTNHNISCHLFHTSTSRRRRKSVEKISTSNFLSTEIFWILILSDSFQSVTKKKRTLQVKKKNQETQAGSWNKTNWNIKKEKKKNSVNYHYSYIQSP